MLVARRRSPWNRASCARGLLSTVQTNTAMCPWPTSRRADSFGVSGGSAGTVGSSGSILNPAHHIPAATLCPTACSTHIVQACPIPCPSHVLVSRNPNPAWFLPDHPLSPLKCLTLPLPITHRAHSGPQERRAGHQPQRTCGRHRGQHLFWPQVRVSRFPGGPEPTVPHSGTRRSWQGHCRLPGSHCKSSWLRCPQAACVMV